MIGDAAAQELYYMGTTETSTGSDEIINNTQSSMADLQILHKRELSLIKLLKDDTDINHLSVINEEFDADGYQLDDVEESDVFNPIDSYNLIKRTSRTWKRIIEKIKFADTSVEKEAKFLLQHFPNWETSRMGVALGILNIHKYYDLDTAELIQVRVLDAGLITGLSLYK